MIRAHAKNWRLLWAAAETYLVVSTTTASSSPANSIAASIAAAGRPSIRLERDRVRALQLMVQAMPLASRGAGKERRSPAFYLDLARLLLGQSRLRRGLAAANAHRSERAARLREGWYYGHAPSGARSMPTAIRSFIAFPSRSTKWPATANAGGGAGPGGGVSLPGRKNEVRWQLADFLQSQFGVQTMAYYGRFFCRQDDDDERRRKNESGTYALHTLDDDETIARLATGIKRFKLPDEFNFIKIYQQIAAEPRNRPWRRRRSSNWRRSSRTAGSIPRRPTIWQRAIKEYGPGDNDYRQQRLDQIVGNWGRFEPIMSQPAGKGATVDFRFRNGNKVSFEAHAIKVAKLLDDVKAYLKTRPNQLDWQKINIGDIGYRLVSENQQQYLGDEGRQLGPGPQAAARAFRSPHHRRPRRCKRPGPICSPPRWPTATRAGSSSGSTTRPSSRSRSTRACFTSSPTPSTGEPIAKANVEFFGYRQQQVGTTNQFKLDISNFAEFTDADGQVVGQPKQDDNQYQWIVTASDARTGPLRLSRASPASGTGSYYDAEYNETKVFTITDRPVYRPEQNGEVQVLGAAREVRSGRHLRLRQPDFHGRDSQSQGREGAHERLHGRRLRRHRRRIPARPPTPRWASINLCGRQSRAAAASASRNTRSRSSKSRSMRRTSRSCSAKKSRPRSRRSTTSARRSPRPRCKYKVLRTSYTQQWYPRRRLGLVLRSRLLVVRRRLPLVSRLARLGLPAADAAGGGTAGKQPPEVVAEAKCRIGADGTVAVEIDTALAKLIHPRSGPSVRDHRRSGRSVAADDRRHGQGARRPQAVQGLSPGSIAATTASATSFEAEFQRPNARPASRSTAKGKLDLLQDHLQRRQAGRDGGRGNGTSTPTPKATPRLQVKASEPGQYRLSYKVTDAKKHTIEGGYLFTIVRRRLRRRRFPLQRPGTDRRQARIRAGRKASSLMVNTNRTRRHRAAVRAAGEWRLSADQIKFERLKGKIGGRRNRRRARKTCPISSSRR